MLEIPITGERYIPESEDTELELEHYERYFAALEFVEGKRVLDAACGEGYGSNLLATKACSVIGVDLDADTIEHAKIKYSDRDNLKYIQGSVENLGFIEDKSIDVVISFETIEHVPEEVQKSFLQEISRVLADDGILVMSSPNKKEYTDRYNFHNKFHVHEMYVNEFVTFLREYFQNVILYRQYLEVASFIDRSDIDENMIHYRKNRQKYNPEGKYVIAVAGNGEMPQKTMSTASLYPQEHYLATLDAFNDYKAEIANTIKLKDEELGRRAAELEKRMSLINEQRAKIDSQANDLKLANEELDERAVELEKRMGLINEQAAQVDKQANDLKLVNEELERRAIELDHRMTEINKRDQEIAVLTMENEDKKSKMAQLEQEKNAVIQELEAIRNKKIYKLYRKVFR